MDEKLARLTDDELSDTDPKNNGTEIKMEEVNEKERSVKEETNEVAEEEEEEEEEEEDEEDDLPTGNV